MKTISEKLAVAGVLVVGFAGCSPGNDSSVMTDDVTGKIQAGVTPPDAIKDPKKFADAHKSSITDPEKYRQAIK
jgi:hypothetical protein